MDRLVADYAMPYSRHAQQYPQFLWFKHDVAAPTTCCRTSCTATAAHGCLSSLKADSGSLRLCLLLFRALASAGGGQHQLSHFRHHTRTHTGPAVPSATSRGNIVDVLYNTFYSPCACRDCLPTLCSQGFNDNMSRFAHQDVFLFASPTTYARHQCKLAASHSGSYFSGALSSGDN